MVSKGLLGPAYFSPPGSIPAAIGSSTPRGKPARVDLVDSLRRGLLAGTDPDDPAYWGDIEDYRQGIVEAADVARIVWLTRQKIWNLLSPTERAQVGRWLADVLDAKVMDTNWLLFPVTVGVILDDLGYAAEIPRRSYDRFKQHYAGHGWFFDSMHPQVIDYYNAWGIGYELFWIRLVAPLFDGDFIADALIKSSDLVAHLISPKGLPIMGRSICYRTAVPAPMVALAHVDPQAAHTGLARRALDAVWLYFVRHGALRGGQLTQGYHGPDLRLVERYTGTGSCHWGLRSIVLAFLNPSGSAFWTAREEKLPVEVADYDLDLGRIGWKVSGRVASGDVTIEIPANRAIDLPIVAYSPLRRVLEMVLMRPLRPYNHAVQYEQRYYSAVDPFPLRH
jgi:hypothetical protein